MPALCSLLLIPRCCCCCLWKRDQAKADACSLLLLLLLCCHIGDTLADPCSQRSLPLPPAALHPVCIPCRSAPSLHTGSDPTRQRPLPHKSRAPVPLPAPLPVSRVPNAAAAQLTAPGCACRWRPARSSWWTWSTTCRSLTARPPRSWPTAAAQLPCSLTRAPRCARHRPSPVAQPHVVRLTRIAPGTL
jgi:hypothetical protein